MVSELERSFRLAYAFSIIDCKGQWVALTWLTHNHTCLPECTARLAPILGLLTLECLLQMLWVATTNIGCAAVRCSEDLPWGPYNSMEPFDYTYVECRYSPPRAAFGDSAYQANVLPIGRLHRSVFLRLHQTTLMPHAKFNPHVRGCAMFWAYAKLMHHPPSAFNQ
jgi:hypothetical protein